jgi:hypothetical protein
MNGRALLPIGKAIILLGFVALCAAAAGQERVHGMWVWKGLSVVDASGGAEQLRKFCQEQEINEIYLSAHTEGNASEEDHVSHFIGLLHRSHIRVEALLSSQDADEPGKYREKLLDHVGEIVTFNQRHPGGRYDGIHLDIEPQQRPENKGPGNLKFLPGLSEAYRAVLALAKPTGLTVNADIQNKLLKGDLAQRKMLLTSLPRLTLMLYELSSPSDGETVEQNTEKLSTSSRNYLAMAYEGLNDSKCARMVIALRTPDYEALLPRMLQTLDEVNAGNPHYLGWARHSYNDVPESPR